MNVTDRNNFTDAERAAILQQEADARVEEGTENLKPEINNFLFPRVPPKMTIEEFEELACNIFSLIAESWAKRR